MAKKVSKELLARRLIKLMNDLPELPAADDPRVLKQMKLHDWHTLVRAVDHTMRTRDRAPTMEGVFARVAQDAGADA
jgi:hypothetical protein